MKNLEEAGWDWLVCKGEEEWASNDVFFCPIPDALQENDKVLKCAEVSLQQYERTFVETKSVSAYLMRFAFDWHPAKEFFPLSLSQPSDSETSSSVEHAKKKARRKLSQQKKINPKKFEL